MSLPNFIIIGAVRSGTTSVYEYLRQHPQVFMCPFKQTNFFISDLEKPIFNGPRGSILNRERVDNLEDYQALFNGVRSEHAIGEASPRYLFTPGTANRIKQLLPDVTLLAILRNPIDRAFSEYSMSKREGLEPCDSFVEALADQERRLREQWAFCEYINKGFYSCQIEEYYKCFNRAQIHVYLFEDLIQNPAGLLQNIFKIIRVDQNFIPDTSKKYNASGLIKNPVLRVLWTRTQPARSIVGAIVPKNFREGAQRFFAMRTLAKLELIPEVRDHLLDIYREDILKLQDLINRDLSAWLGKP